MTPKPNTLSILMDGQYKDENTGETVNPDLLTRTHMYVIPDDLRGGKVSSVILKTATDGH